MAQRGSGDGEAPVSASRPPRFGEALLRRILSVASRDALLGDLAEQHQMIRAQRGLVRAWTWYWRQVIGSVRPSWRNRRAPRGARSGGRMDGLTQDLRQAARSLWRAPGFTAVAGVMLALGIGANTAVYSVVDAVLLRPLPFAQPQSLVMLHELERDGSLDRNSPATYLDWTRRTTSFDGMAAFFPTSLNLGGDEEPERLQVTSVSPSFFDVLRVEPELGRTFSAGSDPGVVPPAGEERAVVLDHGFWTRRFAGDRSIVGRQLRLDGEPYTVVGVLPADFAFLESPDLWVPAAAGVPPPPLDVGDFLAVRGLGYLRVVARLRAGVSLEAARTEMAALTEALADEYPDAMAGKSATAEPLAEQMVGDVRPTLLTLLAAIGLVLLIACGNVANLLLARATGRRREIAVRVALGAGRVRIFRQFMAESLLLAAGGGAVGLLVAFWSLDGLLTLVPQELPRVARVGIDGGVLGFTLALTLLTATAFGSVPALQASSAWLGEGLASGARGGETRSQHRIRDLLVLAEVALSLVLLASAGLTIKSLVRLQSRPVGFDPASVLTMRLWLPEARYPEDAHIVSFYESLHERARGLPGVESAGLAMGAPFGGTTGRFGFNVEGRPAPGPNEQPLTRFQIVSPDYFRTLKIPLRAGRDLSADDRSEGPTVAVASEAFVERFFPDEEAIGKRVTLDDLDDEQIDWIEIVGVVGDVRQTGYESDIEPQLYLAAAQNPLHFMTLLVSPEADPQATIGALRAQVAEIDPQQPVYDVQMMSEIVADTVARPRFNALVLSAFGAAALLLAAVGLFGVMSYSVSQRNREIGIRMAIGADARRVLTMVVRQGMSRVMAGVALGVAGAAFAGRLIESLLFEVEGNDPSVFAGATAVLLAASLLASWLPARRATRVDPVDALTAD